ncbi:hypothetical protein DPEC_G00257910 [Dallia pectoralis]|uniref:Uncharacterized protein n=1 Tax=Dallia pectoralis TaxID=75939 RepID=A0ACC2FQW6_DALPE|nr:hypothetical protein DPEC_G00257910 [Dallia pectoralis]
MDFPVDGLASVSQEDMEKSAQKYMDSILYSNPDSPEYLTLADNTQVPICLSCVGFTPLYGGISRQKALALFSPQDQHKVVGLYLLGRWWSLEDILKTTDPTRDGCVEVKTLGERMVLYILNCVVYRTNELDPGDIAFLRHGENDNATILWKDGQAVGFYSAKTSGSLCISFITQCYQLPVMDSIFVRKCYRRNGWGLQMLEHFIDSFKDNCLGFKCPISESMYKVCGKYLSLYPDDRDLLWEVVGVGGPSQRTNIADKIQTMDMCVISRNLSYMEHSMENLEASENKVFVEEVTIHIPEEEAMECAVEIVEQMMMVEDTNETGETPVTTRNRSISHQQREIAEDMQFVEVIRVEDIEAEAEAPKAEVTEDAIVAESNKEELAIDVVETTTKSELRLDIEERGTTETVMLKKSTVVLVELEETFQNEIPPVKMKNVASEIEEVEKAQEAPNEGPGSYEAKEGRTGDPPKEKQKGRCRHRSTCLTNAEVQEDNVKEEKPTVKESVEEHQKILPLEKAEAAMVDKIFQKRGSISATLTGKCNITKKGKQHSEEKKRKEAPGTKTAAHSSGKKSVPVIPTMTYKSRRDASGKQPKVEGPELEKAVEEEETLEEVKVLRRGTYLSASTATHRHKIPQTHKQLEEEGHVAESMSEVEMGKLVMQEKAEMKRGQVEKISAADDNVEEVKAVEERSNEKNEKKRVEEEGTVVKIAVEKQNDVVEGIEKVKEEKEATIVGFVSDEMPEYPVEEPTVTLKKNRKTVVVDELKKPTLCSAAEMEKTLDKNTSHLTEEELIDKVPTKPVEEEENMATTKSNVVETESLKDIDNISPVVETRATRRRTKIVAAVTPKQRSMQGELSMECKQVTEEKTGNASEKEKIPVEALRRKRKSGLDAPIARAKRKSTQAHKEPEAEEIAQAVPETVVEKVEENDEKGEATTTAEEKLDEIKAVEDKATTEKRDKEEEDKNEREAKNETVQKHVQNQTVEVEDTENVDEDKVEGAVWDGFEDGVLEKPFKGSTKELVIITLPIEEKTTLHAEEKEKSLTPEEEKKISPPEVNEEAPVEIRVDAKKQSEIVEDTEIMDIGADELPNKPLEDPVERGNRQSVTTQPGMFQEATVMLVDQEKNKLHPPVEIANMGRETDELLKEEVAGKVQEKAAGEEEKAKPNTIQGDMKAKSLEEVVEDPPIVKTKCTMSGTKTVAVTTTKQESEQSKQSVDCDKQVVETERTCDETTWMVEEALAETVESVEDKKVVEANPPKGEYVETATTEEQQKMYKEKKDVRTAKVTVVEALDKPTQEVVDAEVEEDNKQVTVVEIGAIEVLEISVDKPGRDEENFQFEEDKTSTPTKEKTLSLQEKTSTYEEEGRISPRDKEDRATPPQEEEMTSPHEEEKTSLSEEGEKTSPPEKEERMSTPEEEEMTSSPEEKERMSTPEEEEMTSPSNDKERSSSLEMISPPDDVSPSDKVKMTTPPEVEERTQVVETRVLRTGRKKVPVVPTSNRKSTRRAKQLEEEKMVVEKPQAKEADEEVVPDVETIVLQIGRKSALSTTTATPRHQYTRTNKELETEADDKLAEPVPETVWGKVTEDIAADEEQGEETANVEWKSTGVKEGEVQTGQNKEKIEKEEEEVKDKNERVVKSASGKHTKVFAADEPLETQVQEHGEKEEDETSLKTQKCKLQKATVVLVDLKNTKLHLPVEIEKVDRKTDELTEEDIDNEIQENAVEEEMAMTTSQQEMEAKSLEEALSEENEKMLGETTAEEVTEEVKQVKGSEKLIEDAGRAVLDIVQEETVEKTIHTEETTVEKESTREEEKVKEKVEAENETIVEFAVEKPKDDEKSVSEDVFMVSAPEKNNLSSEDEERIPVIETRVLRRGRKSSPYISTPKCRTKQRVKQLEQATEDEPEEGAEKEPSIVEARVLRKGRKYAYAPTLQRQHKPARKQREEEEEDQEKVDEGPEVVTKAVEENVGKIFVQDNLKKGKVDEAATKSVEKVVEVAKTKDENVEESMSDKEKVEKENVVAANTVPADEESGPAEVVKPCVEERLDRATPKLEERGQDASTDEQDKVEEVATAMAVVDGADKLENEIESVADEVIETTGEEEQGIPPKEGGDDVVETRLVRRGRKSVTKRKSTQICIRAEEKAEKLEDLAKPPLDTDEEGRFGTSNTEGKLDQAGTKVQSDSCGAEENIPEATRTQTEDEMAEQKNKNEEGNTTEITTEIAKDKEADGEAVEAVDETRERDFIDVEEDQMEEEPTDITSVEVQDKAVEDEEKAITTTASQQEESAKSPNEISEVSPVVETRATRRRTTTFAVATPKRMSMQTSPL